MTHSIIQAGIEAIKAAIMRVGETELPVNTTRPALTVPKSSGPVLMQPKFQGKSLDK